MTRDADLEQVARVPRGCIEVLPLLVAAPMVGIWAFRLGASSIDFKVFCRIRHQGGVGWFEAHHGGAGRPPRLP